MCYSQDRGERVFDIASSTSRLTPSGDPSSRQEGILAHFVLSTPSPNAFRLLRATLGRAGEDGTYALTMRVSALVAGRTVLGRVGVTLGGGVGPTMDVRSP